MYIFSRAKDEQGWSGTLSIDLWEDVILGVDLIVGPGVLCYQCEIYRHWISRQPQISKARTAFLFRKRDNHLVSQKKKPLFSLPKLVPTAAPTKPPTHCHRRTHFS